MTNISTNRVAIVIGATGLIGGQVINALLNDDSYQTVRILVRHTTNMLHPKLEEHLVNFDALSAYDDLIKGDDVFCCLGTTLRKAKSTKNFKLVDYEYPLQVAKMAAENGVKNYLIVTAVGADPNSLVFYSRVKGEVEESLKTYHFHGIHIFRPSLLLGDRKEARIGENLGKLFVKAIDPLMMGPLEKYRGIEAKDVATAMVDAAKNDPQGTFIYESDVIHKMVGKIKQQL